MANVAELVLKVTSDARSAVAGIDQTTQKTSKLGKAGAIAGKALAAGLAVAAVGAFKLAQGAAEDQAAAEKLAQALKTSAGATNEQVAATESWISAQGKALGITDDELRPALTALATATKDVGEAQKLATLAMDISARSGKSLQSVSASLAKAYTTGSATALAKYGVATKDAAGKTRSLTDVTNELTRTYQGSAASAAETVTGKYARAKLQFSELGEEIGYKLIPVMLKAADAGLKTVDWISRNQTTVAALVATLGSLLAITWGVSKAMQAWAAVTKIAAAVQWALNTALLANPVGLIVLAIVALAAGLVVAYKKSETFRNIVNGAFAAVRKAAEFAINFIKSHWKVLFVVLTGPVGAAVLLIIKHRDKIMNAIGAAVDWIKSHWKVLFVILTGPIGLAVLLIIKHRDKITAAIGAAVKWIRDHWSVIKGVLTAPFDAVLTVIDQILSAVQSVIDKISSIDFPDIPDGLNPFSKVVSGRPSKAGAIDGASSTSSGGGDVIYVDMRGLLDVDQAGDQLVRIRKRRARRTNSSVVIA